MITMITKNELFGLLTSLVPEDRKPDNFCSALKYKDNFFRLSKLYKDLEDKFNFKVCQCFDSESKDKYVNTFRFIKIVTLNNEESNNIVDYLHSKYNKEVTINANDIIIEIRFND